LKNIFDPDSGPPVGTFFGRQSLNKNWWRRSLVRRGRSAALGRTVRDLGAGAVSSLRHAGRSAALDRTVRDLATGSSSSSLLESRSRPLGEKILRCSVSTGHPGRPQTTWSHLRIKRSIRERGLGWKTRSCPPGGVRSYGRLGIDRPPKTDLDDVESNRGGGGYVEDYN
jgi:hypothetical protein